jgi:hypothetical protein
MTEGAEAERMSHRGRCQVLSHDQKLIIGGWVQFRNNNYEDTTGLDIKDFAKLRFDVDLKPYYISRMMSELGHSPRNPVPITLQVEHGLDDATAFLQGVHDRHLPPARIVAVDKTGFWDDILHVKHFAPIGWCVVV